MGFGSIPSPDVAPLTPAHTPSKEFKKKCLECGSGTHLRANCPNKLNFCPRYNPSSHYWTELNSNYFLGVLVLTIRSSSALTWEIFVGSVRSQAVVTYPMVTWGRSTKPLIVRRESTSLSSLARYAFLNGNQAITKGNTSRAGSSCFIHISPLSPYYRLKPTRIN